MIKELRETPADEYMELPVDTRLIAGFHSRYEDEEEYQEEQPDPSPWQRWPENYGKTQYTKGPYDAYVLFGAGTRAMTAGEIKTYKEYLKQQEGQWEDSGKRYDFKTERWVPK